MDSREKNEQSSNSVDNVIRGGNEQEDHDVPRALAGSLDQHLGSANRGQARILLQVNIFQQHINQQLVQHDNRRTIISNQPDAAGPSVNSLIKRFENMNHSSSEASSHETNFPPSYIRPSTSSSQHVQQQTKRTEIHREKLQKTVPKTPESASPSSSSIQASSSQQSSSSQPVSNLRVLNGKLDLHMAFRKLKKVVGQLYDREFDVDLSKFDNPARNFPEVYPKLLLVDLYKGKFIPDDDQYDANTRQIEINKSDKNISIDYLISRYKSQNFISIVGYPGSGKTTLSKRLARHLNEDRDFLVLKILFMNMSDDVKLSLEEFLLGNVNFNLKKEEKNVIFDWIQNHSQNCFFIFDGFDQVNWNLLTKVENADYNTLLTCREHVSNLCHGYFLLNCHIVFTSRPHAMLEIPPRCRPTQTFFVRDLTPENMNKLSRALINDEQKSREILDKLTLKTPHLKSMCYNPLMLQLYLRASLDSSQEATTDISTMTRMFHRVLEHLKESAHSVSLTDEIVIKLSKLAYKATKNKTVLITAEDLDKEKLTSEKVQALVVTLFSSNRTCGLLEGNRRLYFTHQTFQEYFSAIYMVHEMSLKKFKSFVQSNLLVDHWSVVVEFLSGLLLDPNRNNDKKLLKKQILISGLLKEIQKVAANNDDCRSIFAISKILRESNDEEVIVAAGSRFDGGRILMESSDTQTDIHAVTSFLKSMPAQVRFLDLSRCRMTSSQFRPWIEAIKSMPGSIVGMYLHGNLLSSVDDIIEILEKVEEKIVMVDCLDNGDRKLRLSNMEERARLQEALDRLENEELKIMVHWDDDNDDRDRIYLTHKNRVY